ncbi:MAG: hypothetical protein HY696_12310 [Deltaproteobacteria bacterium]|nr:hypothetical protein [Deltaproteobacteria bacterium]
MRTIRGHGPRPIGKQRLAARHTPADRTGTAAHTGPAHALPAKFAATGFASPRLWLWMGATVAAAALAPDSSFAAAGIPLWLAFAPDATPKKSATERETPSRTERRHAARAGKIATRVFSGAILGRGDAGFFGALRLLRAQAAAVKDAGRQWDCCLGLAQEAALALDISHTALAESAINAGRHNADHKYSFVGKGEPAMRGYIATHEALTAAATRTVREPFDYHEAAVRYERAASQLSDKSLAMLMSWIFNTIGTRGLMQPDDTSFEETEATRDWQRIAAWRVGEYRALASRANARATRFAEDPADPQPPTADALPLEFAITDFARIRTSGTLPKLLKAMGQHVHRLKTDNNILEALPASRDYATALFQAGQFGQAQYVLETALAWAAEFQARCETGQHTARLFGIVEGQIHGMSDDFAARSDRWEAQQRVARIEIAQLHFQLGQLLQSQWRPLIAAMHFAQVRRLLAESQDTARSNAHDFLQTKATQWQLAALAEAGIVERIEALRAETLRLEARDRANGDWTGEAIEAKRRWKAALGEADLFDLVPIEPDRLEPATDVDLSGQIHHARHAVATELLQQATHHFEYARPQIGLELLLLANEHAEAIADATLQAAIQEIVFTHEGSIPTTVLRHFVEESGVGREGTPATPVPQIDLSTPTAGAVSAEASPLEEFEPS